MPSPLRIIFISSIILLLTIPASQVSAQTLDSLKLVLQEAKTEEQEIDALKNLGNFLAIKGDTGSLFYYKQLLDIGTRRGDKELVARTYNSIGVTWYYAKDLKRSSEAYYTGIEFTDDTPEFYEVRTRFYTNLGWNYTQFKNPKKALAYYLKAEEYTRLSNKESDLGQVLNNKGVAEFNLKQYEASLKTLTESLRISRKLKNSIQERYNLNNIGTTLTYLGRLAAAEDTLKKAFTLNLEMSDTVELVNNIINLNTVYQKKKQYAKATEMLLNAMTLSRHIKAETKLLIYEDLSRVFVAQHDYKDAFHYQASYIALSDSVADLRFHEYSLELDRKYNNAMQDRDLEQAKKELAEHKFYITVILSALTLLLLGAVFLWYLFMLKKRNEVLLIRLNKEIEARAEELREANDNIQAINQNLEDLVDERTRIIKEQNKRLLQFGFMNSHEIRGPIATMMGLIDLLQKKNTPKEQENIVTYLKKSSLKLDGVVRTMTRRLEKEGLAMSDENEEDNNPSSASCPSNLQP